MFVLIIFGPLMFGFAGDFELVLNSGLVICWCWAHVHLIDSATSFADLFELRCVDLGGADEWTRPIVFDGGEEFSGVGQAGAIERKRPEKKTGN